MNSELFFAWLGDKPVTIIVLALHWWLFGAWSDDSRGVLLG
jgi:hypothetical protein